MPTSGMIARLVARSRTLASRLLADPSQHLATIDTRLDHLEAARTEHIQYISQNLEHIKNIVQRIDALEARLGDLAERTETSLALGWDHVALTRRLAAIEDRLNALPTAKAEDGAPCALAG